MVFQWQHWIPTDCLSPMIMKYSYPDLRWWSLSSKKNWILMLNLTAELYFLEVNNKLILPNDGSGILSESILYQPQITLNHNHSIITVNFSLSNYVSVLRNRIYYKLEGFDKDWMSAGYRKGITYTNLNPGKYKLIIKSSEEYSGRESICKEIDICDKTTFL